MTATANDLGAGFEILWYRIESVLGRGGFGITYLATDTNLGIQVAIKEYLPHDFASRGKDSTVQPISREREDVFSWGLERFMKEAQTLAQFQHPNIVRVLSVFQRNNTGYMVMEYEHGDTLLSFIEGKKSFTQDELEHIFFPIMHGLSAVHSEGFIHRDIKPANIYIREDGSPVLLDFGAARQAVGVKTRTLTAMLTVGYAPLEQYNEGSEKQGPWTDIYSLGACMHHCIIGKKPDEPTMRIMSVLHEEPDPYTPLSHMEIAGFTPHFLRGIDQSLMLQVHERPQSLAEFEDLLTGRKTIDPLPADQFSAPPETYEATIIRPVNELLKSQQPGHNKQSADNKRSQVKKPAGKGSKRLRLFIAAGVLGFLVLIITRVILLSPTPTQEEPEQTADITRIVEPEQTTDITRIEEPEQTTDITSIEDSGQTTDITRIEDPVGEHIKSLLLTANRLMQSNKGIRGKLNAVAVYQDVLKLDDQNREAIDALDLLAEQLATVAMDQIKRGDLSDAKTVINSIQSIDSNHKELSSLNFELEKRTVEIEKLAKLESLIANAQRALTKRQVYFPMETSAYSYFRQALVIDPNNQVALDGMSEVFDLLLNEGHEALNRGDTNVTKELIALIKSIKTESPGINKLEKEYTTLVKVKELTVAADLAYRKRNYTLPKGKNAIALYMRILAQSPSNMHAKSQLDRIANYYSEQTRSAIKRKDKSAARTNLQKLASNFPDYAGISGLRAEVIAIPSPTDIIVPNPGETPRIIGLIPVGINQRQEDVLVVQDIVGKFVQYFNNKDTQNLLGVSQLDTQQVLFFQNIFNTYKSFKLEMNTSSFSVNRTSGLASAKFIITGLVNQNNRLVEATANWTKVRLTIKKKSGKWLKAEVGSF